MDSDWSFFCKDLLMVAKKGCNTEMRSSSLMVMFHFNKAMSSLSEEFTSWSERRPSVYLVQCLFMGLESFKDLAARINEAKKILWRVVSMPTALPGRMFLNLVKYTKEAMRVGVWTLEHSMSLVMKRVKETESFLTGAAVTFFRMRLGLAEASCLTWMTEQVVAAKKSTISRVTGCLANILSTSLLDIVKK